MRVSPVQEVYHHTPSEIAKKLPFYVHGIGWRSYSFHDRNRRNEGEFYDYQIQLVIRGKGYVVWKDANYTLRTGDFFFLDLNKAHEFITDKEDPWEVIWVHFSGSHAAFFYTQYHESKPIFPLQDRKTVENWLRELVDLFANPPIGLDLLANEYLTKIVTYLSVNYAHGVHKNRQSHVKNRDIVSKAIEYIQNHYQDPLMLEQITKELSIPPTYFSRLFKKITGYTMKEYMYKYRLTVAKHLLTNTEMSISDISLQSGFYDQSHFHRVFKKYEKSTPLQYRINHTNL